MAYVGIDGKARKITNAYIGVNGVARKVKKAYIGVDGIARLWWDATPGGANEPDKYPILRSGSNWYFYNSNDIAPSKITSITFVNQYNPTPSWVNYTWKIDKDNTGSLTGYTVQKKDVIISFNGNGGAYFHPDGWQASATPNITTIDNLDRKSVV